MKKFLLVLLCLFFGNQVFASEKCGYLSPFDMEKMERAISGNSEARAKLADVNEFIEVHKKTIKDKKIDGKNISNRTVEDCKRDLQVFVKYKMDYYGDN